MKVHRPADIEGVSADIFAPDCIEVLSAAPRLRLRPSLGQMTKMSRRSAPPADEKAY